MERSNRWRVFFFTGVLLILLVDKQIKAASDVKPENEGKRRRASQANWKLTDEGHLLEYLFKKQPQYSTEIRPVFNNSDIINVTVHMTYNNIIDVDEKQQILTSSIWLRRKWINQLLAWDPAEFNGLQSVVIDSALVWMPDTVLYNSVEEGSGQLSSVTTQITLYSNGLNVWAVPLVFKSSCKINVKDFPFDEQECPLKYGSWNFHGFVLDIYPEFAYGAVASNKIDNGEWLLIDISSVRNVMYYPCCTEPYPDVTYIVRIKRRPLFYVYNLVVPNILISLLAFYSFFVPIECGERISFIVTVILSLTVFLLLVAENIPATSDAIPLIAIFYTATIVEVSLALVATGISLRINYSYLYTGDLSPFFNFLVFSILAPVFGDKKSIQLLKAKERVSKSLELDDEKIRYEKYKKSNAENGIKLEHLKERIEETDVKVDKSEVAEFRCKVAAHIADTCFMWIFLVIFLVASLTIMFAPR